MGFLEQVVQIARLPFAALAWLVTPIGLFTVSSKVIEWLLYIFPVAPSVRSDIATPVATVFCGLLLLGFVQVFYGGLDNKSPDCEPEAFTWQVFACALAMALGLIIFFPLFWVDQLLAAVTLGGIIFLLFQPYVIQEVVDAEHQAAQDVSEQVYINNYTKEVYGRGAEIAEVSFPSVFSIIQQKRERRLRQNIAGNLKDIEDTLSYRFQVQAIFQLRRGVDFVLRVSTRGKYALALGAYGPDNYKELRAGDDDDNASGFNSNLRSQIEEACRSVDSIYSTTLIELNRKGEAYKRKDVTKAYEEACIIRGEYERSKTQQLSPAKLHSIHVRLKETIEAIRNHTVTDSTVFTDSSSNKEQQETRLLKEKTATEEAAAKHIIEREHMAQNDKIADLLQELDQMIGLKRVKEEVLALIASVEANKTRIKNGQRPATKNSHMIFYGNPGTGKTTAARLIGRIYKALGVLEKGHFVSAERVDFVGEYLGWTAPKVKKKFQEAKGGILFIDEAYSLKTEARDSFGQEAIDAMMTDLEEFRGQMVVILAGYEREMKEFEVANSGLKSRFPRRIYFDDYSPDEVFQIFENLSEKARIGLSQEAVTKVKSLIQELHRRKDEPGVSFSNGRLARNVLEEAQRRAERRSYREGNIEEMKSFSILQKCDIPDISEAINFL